MARPTKVGLDYFALDVKMNDEVEIIEAEHGLEGFAILIKLFQRIYSEGYYHLWTDREQILLSNRIGVDRNKLTTVVNDCIKWNIFNEDLYNKYNILTSRRIQEHYFTATYKRIDVLADKRYLVFDVSDRTNIKYIRVNDIRNEDTIVINDIQSTQSKVKENRVKDTKKDKREQMPPAPYKEIKDLFHKICTSYSKIRSLSNEREKHIKARWKQYNHDIEIFKELFNKAEDSKFLKGENDRGWKANFDWLINENNMAKVLEGRYIDYLDENFEGESDQLMKIKKIMGER